MYNLTKSTESFRQLVTIESTKNQIFSLINEDVITLKYRITQLEETLENERVNYKSILSYNTSLKEEKDKCFDLAGELEEKVVIHKRTILELEEKIKSLNKIKSNNGK